jgi:hypothetical protein
VDLGEHSTGAVTLGHRSGQAYGGRRRRSKP